MEIFQLEQTSVQWKLSSVSSKVSMKAVLLHNRNKFSSVPVVQEGHMKKRTSTFRSCCKKICYYEHR